MEPQHPQLADLDAVFRVARDKIARGIAIEPQLAEGWERQQAQQIVGRALLELTAGLRDWFDQYVAAGGPLVTGEQGNELRRLLGADD